MESVEKDTVINLFWSTSPPPAPLILPTCKESFSSVPPQHHHVRAHSQGIEAAQHFARLSLYISQATDTLYQIQSHSGRS